MVPEQVDSEAVIPEKPHQPALKFPQHSFGNQQRALCASCYTKYPWLHYQEADDSVLCFYCHMAEKRGIGSSAVVCNKSADKAFIITGFSNWKKALESFDKHQCSLHHRDCLDQLQVSSKTKSVVELLQKGYAEEQVLNRKMLKIIISSIRYLSRQGLALRGRYKVTDNEKLHGKSDSNFLQLLKTRAEDIPSLLEWMKRPQAKYTSLDIQNEILSITALSILRQIA